MNAVQLGASFGNMGVENDMAYQVGLGLALAPLVADDFHHTGLHQDKLKAAVKSRAKHLFRKKYCDRVKRKELCIAHLFQKLLNHRFICHKSPEVKLKVVAVNLSGIPT